MSESVPLTEPEPVAVSDPVFREAEEVYRGGVEHPASPVSAVRAASASPSDSDPPLPTLVIILARKFTTALADRLSRLLDAGLDAHAVVDCSVEPAIPSHDSLCTRVHFVPDAALLAAGFTDLQSKTCGKKLTAWERATYWCTARRRTFAYAWFVEDDVLWDTASALAALVRGYAPDSADLVTQDIAASQAARRTWPHWAGAHGLVPREALSASFNVICRMSPRMLLALGRLARSRGRLGFHEVLFRSLAGHEGLRVSLFHDTHETLTPGAPPLVGTPRLLLRFRPPFTDAEIRAELGRRVPGMLFHPVKHFSRELDL